jgi:hypothetical protein
MKITTLLILVVPFTLNSLAQVPVDYDGVLKTLGKQGGL